MKALYVGPSSLSLKAFSEKLSEWAFFGPLDERLSSNAPGGKYYGCRLPGIVLKICEDCDDTNSPERFIVILEFSIKLKEITEDEIEMTIFELLKSVLIKQGIGAQIALL
jgi:hypothetical protein